MYLPELEALTILMIKCPLVAEFQSLTASQAFMPVLRRAIIFSHVVIAMVTLLEFKDKGPCHLGANTLTIPSPMWDTLNL